jgi:hypothetical protein
MVRDMVPGNLFAWFFLHVPLFVPFPFFQEKGVSQKRVAKIPYQLLPGSSKTIL